MKTNKGISLVALIVTIIVMVILAGVAISAILPEDGVINKTETASIETEKKQMLEQISTCAIYGTNGKIKVKETYENTEELYGQDKVILRFPFEETEINSETEEIILTVQGKYTDCNYRITTTIIEIYNGEIPQLPEPEPEVELNIGDIVYYDSNLDGTKEQWVVYEVGEDILEIISKQAMGSIYMGYKYEDIDDYKAVDLDGNGSISQQEKAIYSFNNAVEIINYYCQKQVTATDNDGVRSIGGIPYAQVRFKPTAYNKSNWFENNVVYQGDNYKTESNIKLNDVIGTTITITGKFWYASKNLSDNTRYVTGYLYTGNSWQYSSSQAFNVDSSGNFKIDTTSLGTKSAAGVLPIVTNPINISIEP